MFLLTLKKSSIQENLIAKMIFDLMRLTEKY